MAGYWGNSDATSAVFKDGWYRTGDIVVCDESQYYYMVDRARDMIISGGLNVYPAEVEAAISENPAVDEVAVIGVPDDHWGESVKAFVVLRPGEDASEKDIIAAVQTRLAGYKKPRFVEFVAALPKGATGKILKRELRDSYWSSRDRAV